MTCPKCGRELRMFSERKLDYRKYKCDNCNKVTELEIDNRDKMTKINHYEDKPKRNLYGLLLTYITLL